MFRTLQPSIAPSVVYKIFDKNMYKRIVLKMAKLWTRLPRNEQETCTNCRQCFCNLASHLVIECVSNDLQRKLFKLTCWHLLGNTNTSAMFNKPSDRLYCYLLGCQDDVLSNFELHKLFLFHSYQFVFKATKCIN